MAGLDHCLVPGRIKSESGNIGGECELGLGLHDESGVKRMQTTSPEDLFGDMIDLIISSRAQKAIAEGGSDHEEFVAVIEGKVVDEAVLHLNSFGGILQLEMATVLEETRSQLGKFARHHDAFLLMRFPDALACILTRMHWPSTSRDRVAEEQEANSL